MATFADLGIKTYEDYKRNEQDIFDIIYRMVGEYIVKHPNFVRQTSVESQNNFVDIKDFNMGDRIMWGMNK